tara:strand:+ start:6098 stop:7180 length:1083 start_codon:yes stop_codon:yes gene_type:complete
MYNEKINEHRIKMKERAKDKIMKLRKEKQLIQIKKRNKSSSKEITPKFSITELDYQDPINTFYHSFIKDLSLTNDPDLSPLLPYINTKAILNINKPLYILSIPPVKKLVIVSCIYKRMDISTFCIKRWSEYKHIHKIIVVYSLDEDFQRIKDLPNIHFVKHDNNPLSLKFQKGVSEAKQFNADAIMILGSDDIVSQEYIDKSHDYLDKEYQYIGINTWLNSCFYRNNFIYTEATYRYRVQGDGIGAGRIISKYLLDMCKWNLYVFSRPLNKCLDGNSFKNIKPHISKDKIIFDIVQYPLLCTKSIEEEKSISFKNTYLSFIINTFRAQDTKSINTFIYNHPKFIPYSWFILKHFFNHSSS